MVTRIGTVVLLCFAVLAPQARGVPPDPGRDHHSFAEPGRFRVEHVDLALEADFASRRLSGAVDLTVRRLDPAAHELVLDTRDLVVRAVWLVGAGGALDPLSFTPGLRDPVLGSPLRIDVRNAGTADAATFRVRISYQTRPEATGLQWLEARQTAGRRWPFLYTQSEAIHARSWIPLQDSPQVRVTYHAVIHTPPGLRAVMSAGNDPSAPLNGRFEFDMPEAVPPYLIALAVGDLGFRATGPRSGVYAEPVTLERAAHEFADVESMLQTAERLFGPYRWGRYDLLVLPPSFPFGGMENPRLTFVTPTIIAGDRSLVSLVAHELAHSWSGNLVSNATWRDFWLNEGFTVYLERRIVEAVYGLARAQEEAVLGVQQLREEFATVPPADEVLAVDLRGRDPDEALNEVPYEKGRLFLYWLESRFGRDAFDAFLRGYFDRFAFRSITTEQFLEHLDAAFVAAHPGAATRAQVDEWVYRPGLPAFAVSPEAPGFDEVDRERAAWLDGRRAAPDLDIARWSVQQRQHFLDGLPAGVAPARLAELDAVFSFSTTENSEIAFSWFRQAVRSDHRAVYPALERYLIAIGRRRFIRPLYVALMQTPQGAAFARRVYALARPGYHPIAQASLDAIVVAGAGAGGGQ